MDYDACEHSDLFQRYMNAALQLQQVDVGQLDVNSVCQHTDTDGYIAYSIYRSSSPNEKKQPFSGNDTNSFS